MSKKKTDPDVGEVLPPDEQKPDFEYLAKYYKAEFDNFRKRNQDNAMNAYRDARADTVLAILPVIDSIYEAAKHGSPGIEIVIRKFEKILEELGIEEIQTKPNDDFDPHLHNAVAGEGDKIKEVWQRGYKYNNKILRPTTVLVGKGE